MILRQVNVGNSKTANVLVMLLVRFTEIFSIQYISDRKAFLFSFVIDDYLSDKECAILQKHILDCIELYNQFESPITQKGTVDLFCLENYTFITYEMPMHTFQTIELKLLTGILRERYGTRIVADEIHLHTDVLNKQEEKIQSFIVESPKILDDITIEAIRDGSRVFVYNKS